MVYFSASWRDVSASTFTANVVGALTFALSDTVLAVNKFHFGDKLPYAKLVVMATYYGAQILIGSVAVEGAVREAEALAEQAAAAEGGAIRGPDTGGFCCTTRRRGTALVAAGPEKKTKKADGDAVAPAAPAKDAGKQGQQRQEKKSANLRNRK